MADVSIKQTVANRFTDSMDYADDLWNLMETSFNDLSASFTAEDFPDEIDVSYPDIDIDIPLDSQALRPEIDSDLGANFPSSPSMKSISSVDTPEEVDIPQADSFLPDNLDLSFPDAPDSTLPSDPNVEVDLYSEAELGLPNYEDYIRDLPVEPTLNQITPIQIPDLDIPVWDVEEPDLTVESLTTQFNYTEDEYTSELAVQLSTSLLEELQAGGTGLDEDVEQAIYDRARSRRQIQDEQAFTVMEEYFCSKGWDFPSGSVNEALQETINNMTRLDEELNETITITQAELAQKNTHFIIDSSMKWEATLINKANDVANRTLTAAKARVDSIVQVYLANLKGISERREIYQTKGNVFATRINVLLGEIQYWKTKLEAQALEGTLQETQVKLYLGKLQGVQIIGNLYKTFMEGAGIKLEIDKNKLARGRLLLDLHLGKLSSKVASYNMYVARVNGEGAKAQAYAGAAQAYATAVRGAEIEASIETKKIDSQIAKASLDLEDNKTTMEIFKSESEAEALRLQALVKEREVQLGIYKVDASAVEVEANVQMAELRAKLEKYKNETDVVLKEADMNERNALQYNALRLEAMKSMTNALTQAFASSLSAVSAIASMGYNESVNNSKTHSWDETKELPTTHYQHIISE